MGGREKGKEREAGKMVSSYLWKRERKRDGCWRVSLTRPKKREGKKGEDRVADGRLKDSLKKGKGGGKGFFFVPIPEGKRKGGGEGAHSITVLKITKRRKDRLLFE